MNATLSADEIESVTGYRRQADQLAELHRQGFYRARLSPTRARVILERVHYDAVCAGSGPSKSPKVRVPTVRAMSAA